jgi:hypothetical protein
MGGGNSKSYETSGVDDKGGLCMNPFRFQELFSAARIAFLITFFIWFLAKDHLQTGYFAAIYLLSFAGTYIAKRSS